MLDYRCSGFVGTTLFTAEKNNVTVRYVTGVEDAAGVDEQVKLAIRCLLRTGLKIVLL